MSKTDHMPKLAKLGAKPDSPGTRAARTGFPVWQPALDDAAWQPASAPRTG